MADRRRTGHEFYPLFVPAHAGSQQVSRAMSAQKISLRSEVFPEPCRCRYSGDIRLEFRPQGRRLMRDRVESLNCQTEVLTTEAQRCGVLILRALCVSVVKNFLSARIQQFLRTDLR